MDVGKDPSEPDVAGEADFHSPISPASGIDLGEPVVETKHGPEFHQIGSVEGGATPLPTRGMTSPSTVWARWK